MEREKITAQQMIDVAKQDLPRLSKKFELPVGYSKGKILWEHALDCYDYRYDAFLKSYKVFEPALRRWLDCQRWLHKVDFSDCWLSFESSDQDYTHSAKFVVYKSA